MLKRFPCRLDLRLGRFAALLLIPTVIIPIGGCSLLPPGRVDVSALPEAEFEEPASVEVAETTGVGLATVPTADRLPDWNEESGPDGFPDLEYLENLCRRAQALSADGRFAEAEDHLLVLGDQIGRPVPADADTQYVGQLRSLERRAVLLWAVLAEQMAFEEAPTAVDSLLDASYARLQAAGLPDSLVPATGPAIGAVTADLLEVDNREVQRWTDHFAGRGRVTYQAWLDRMVVVQPLVARILAEAGLPGELIYLAMIESGFSTRAVSSASAVGPWQFMAGTSRGLGLRTNWWLDERRDVELSTRAAARYLKDLHDQFGNWALVLAAYNTGGGRMERKIREHGHDNFWQMRLPAQTTAHIPKFIAAAKLGTDPGQYGFELRDLPPLDYDVVEVSVATDLAVIARCAGVETAVIKELNPALLRGSTPPETKRYEVRVPAGTGPAATRALAAIPPDERLTWRRHEVKRGETLSGIAAGFGTSVADISRLNRLSDSRLIRPGDQLLIPMPAELGAVAGQRAAAKGNYIPPAGHERVSYRVKSGDTLGGIARKLGVSLKHLRLVNNLPGSNLIKPGQRLYAYRAGTGQ